MKSPELVFALVGAVGADFERVESQLKHRLGAFRYEIESVRLSSLLEDPPLLEALGVELRDDSELARIESRIEAGNALRSHYGEAAVAKLAIARILELRDSRDANSAAGVAYILRSLKREEEVHLLREVYGSGLFVIGVHSSEAKRSDKLEAAGMNSDEIERIVHRDHNEEHVVCGQRTRDTFQHCDAFVSLDNCGFDAAIRRIVDLIFGDPFHTPTRDEYLMFLAFSASTRSSDLSRQVGASLLSEHGDLLAVGANDAPQPGGGQYWPPSDGHQGKNGRDMDRGYDSNERERERIISAISKAIQPMLKDSIDETRVLTSIRSTDVSDITEFGRSVHAEMECLLSCARKGISVHESILYSTTFPCHNCAKHIVGAGVRSVVFIEPYPKSQALDLHGDAIILESGSSTRRAVDHVTFTHFMGVGPRRYAELFSTILPTGERVKRKQVGGDKQSWSPTEAQLRNPLLDLTYKQRELHHTKGIKEQWYEPDPPA